MTTQTFTPSLAELFVTNLRLLDIDTRSDWPNITPKTFSSKDLLGNNQKARIRCSEWALYRLFEIWDPDETSYVRSCLDEYTEYVFDVELTRYLMTEAATLLSPSRTPSIPQPERRLVSRLK